MTLVCLPTYNGDLQYVLHWNDTQQVCVHRDRQLIMLLAAHKHTHHGCLQEVSSWEPRGDRCVKTTYWFHSVLLWCCFVSNSAEKKKKKQTTHNTLDLICSAYCWCIFYKSLGKTPCSMTLKSNLALQGLRAHVKSKATLGVGIKNWVASRIKQTERCAQLLNWRNGIF